jgi:hypothetical protein
MFTKVFYWYSATKRIALKSSVFLDITPCSLLKVNRHFGRTYHLRLQFATCFILVSCMAYSLILKMEATCSSETSAGFRWTTWHYIQDHRTLHNHCCENLKSSKNCFHQEVVVFLARWRRARSHLKHRWTAIPFWLACTWPLWAQTS